MEPLSDRTRALGDAVATVSDRASGRGAIDAARRRLLAPAPVRRRTARSIQVLAAVLCIACLTAAWTWADSKAVAFHVGAPPVRGAVGSWVAAGTSPLDVRFSEGSTLTLSAGARMRVTSTSTRGAEVLVERGEVRASIVHAGRDTRWALRAGPFEVRVTGTAFDASWDPATETFELRLREGSVAVSGPLVPPGRVVVAGERLVVSIRDGRMELSSNTASDAPRVPDPPAAQTATPDANKPAIAPPPAISCATASARAHAPPSSAALAIAPPEWKALASAGKHKQAMAALDRAGFSAEIARASAPELLLVADAARFAGQPARAREALLLARTRHGHRGRSAFLLGKIAADQQGASAEGATWFETYLREDPFGPLAEQALGRLLELEKDPERARRHASRYLASYPSGAHAALARSIASP